MRNQELVDKVNEAGNHGRTPRPVPNLDLNRYWTPSPGGLAFVLDYVRRLTTVSPLPDLNLMPQLEGQDRVFEIGSGSRAPDENTQPLMEVPPGFENNRLYAYIDSPRPRKRFQKRRQLVRVADLGPEEQKQHREVLKRTRMIYDALRLRLKMEEKNHPPNKLRSESKAAYMIRDRGLWLNNEKHIVGAIPGVEIGDIFLYRMELRMVGLHGQSQSGIDYLKAQWSPTGEPIATCIVVSGGYEDDEDSGDVLVYTGQGGQDRLGRQREHQVLESGNLAMERSFHYGIEVRVFRGFKYENNTSSKLYVYDGLYKILECWFGAGKSGFMVFKFVLARNKGQPEMGSSIMKFAQTLRSNPLMVRPNGYISLDMSSNQEDVPVYLYNDVDGDQEPLKYTYLAKSIFSPETFHQGEINMTGCDCDNLCSEDCLCARKNGGEFAYDDFENLLRGKAVVFECGISCKCGPSCKNRVTQKGLQKRLEVFKSKESGWGVKTLDIIQAGAFICEYAGVVVTNRQAEIMSMNGDIMIYPGRLAEKGREWGDISMICPHFARPDYPSLPPLDFGMDVSRMRNMAFYIGHSKEPNVMVQFVLFDHNKLLYPRIMLFALENIAPLTELSMDYGLALQVNRNLSICN